MNQILTFLAVLLLPTLAALGGASFNAGGGSGGGNSSVQNVSISGSNGAITFVTGGTAVILTPVSSGSVAWVTGAVIPGTLILSDTDAAAFASRLASAGFTMSTAQQVAFSKFVASAKAHGYWGNLLEVHPYFGSTITAAAVKLKVAPGCASSLVNYGFTNSSILPSGGIQGDGSSYFDTGVGWSTFFSSGLGGLAVSIASPYTPASVEWPIGCGAGSSPVLEMEINGAPYGEAAGIGGAWGVSNPVSVGGVSVYNGFYQVERSSLSLISEYDNGVLNSTNTATSNTSTITSSIHTFEGHAFATKAAMNWTSIDNGAFTNAQSLAYAQDVAALQAALGVVSPLPGNMVYVPFIGQSLSSLMCTSSAATPSASVYSAMTQGCNIIACGGNPNDAPSLFANEGAQGLIQPIVSASADAPVLGFTASVGAYWRNLHPNSNVQDPVVSCYAVGATGYGSIANPNNGLCKGTYPYSNSITAIANAKTVASIYRSGSFVVPAIVCIHGEQDYQNPNYGADLLVWQSDYQTDIKAITGQTGTIPMFVAQSSAWTAPSYGDSWASSPFYALADSLSNPGRIILVTPEYFLPHNSADGVHLTPTAFHQLAEYFAKAYNKVILSGSAWSPLRPTTIALSGSVITVNFTGNVGNLVLDTTLVSDPGNYGFTYSDSTSSASISSVALTSATTVQVTLNQAPTGSSQMLGYANNGTLGNFGGPTTGPRGCLRDSDATPDLFSTTPLYNWCVHFNYAIPSSN